MTIGVTEEPVPPAIDCDRRMLLRSATRAALALGVIPVGQVGSASPGAAQQQPARPASPASRIVRLGAGARSARLGGEESPESTLFRLTDRSTPAGEAHELPVIRARSGETLRFELENGLPQPIQLHARGARQPNANDGIAPFAGSPIAPRGSGSFEFSARQSGTFLLAPSLPAHVSEQSARGLQAIIVVDEPAPPPVDHDFALAIGDFRLAENGMLAADFGAKRDGARVGRLGNRLTTNGRPAPGRMSVRPGARVRLRLVNVSNARFIPLRVTNLVARVIAIDSTPCAPFDPLKRTVVLSPASRIDLIVDCPAEAGVEGVVEARFGAGVPIFAFRTEGAALGTRGPVMALPDPGLPPAIRLQDAARADLVITGGAPRDLALEDSAGLDRLFPDASRLYQVNGGHAGFAGKPVVSVRRGKVVVLALMNRTAWPQVIAVHGHSFRLLHPYDDGWEPYFLDTLYLNPGVTSRIALIADNPGRWAIRSTVAEHFAGGVMTWFEVT